VRYEDEGFVARGARLSVATDREARGVLVGRATDSRTEPPDRVVKAVTYHDLHVLPGVPGTRGAASSPWRARIVLDL
jgi:SHS2 domain-containing protein